MNDQELDAILAKRTLEDYQKGSGESKSMMDHYLDALFYLAPSFPDDDPELLSEVKSDDQIMRKFFFRLAAVFRCVFSGCMELNISVLMD